MTKKNKTILIKRAKGFAWGMFNVSWVAAALASLNYIIEAVPTLGLSEFATMTIIMLANQASKYLNTR